MSPGKVVVKPVVKPGYKTTEFWVSVLTTVGAVTASLAGSLPPKWAAIVAVVSIAAYNLSRGFTKNGVPHA